MEISILKFISKIQAMKLLKNKFSILFFLIVFNSLHIFTNLKNELINILSCSIFILCIIFEDKYNEKYQQKVNNMKIIKDFEKDFSVPEIVTLSLFYQIGSTCLVEKDKKIKEYVESSHYKIGLVSLLQRKKVYYQYHYLETGKKLTTINLGDEGLKTNDMLFRKIREYFDLKKSINKK